MKNTPFKEYSKTLHLAYKIVDEILYPIGIKSHQDFADRINKSGDINKIIITNISK